MHKLIWYRRKVRNVSICNDRANSSSGKLNTISGSQTEIHTYLLHRTFSTETKRKKMTEKDRDTLWSENHALKIQLNHLFKIFIRTLVVLKYLLRISAVVATYFWLGKIPSIALAAFILVIASLQSGIDKVQKTVHPDWHSSEWDCE